jgi:hypothetical protein
MRSCLYIFIGYILPTCLVWSSQAKIPITVETDVYHYAQALIGDKKIVNIENFSGPNSHRDVVEFILVQKALALGGSTLDFTFTLGNYDARNIKLLQSGLLLISFDSLWLSHVSKLTEEVYISAPVIKRGEYLAGVYTSTNNNKALSTKNLADLKKLSIISNKNWHVDWKTILQIAPKSITHDEEWLSMAKLVSLQWIDVMLAPFSNGPPFIYKDDGYEITAIEGIKVALNDSRHFVVSKKHPKGKETFIALQKGLTILRQRGTITKAFQESGFFNKHVKNWSVINKSFVTESENNNTE